MKKPKKAKRKGSPQPALEGTPQGAGALGDVASERMGSKQREARTAEAIGGDLFGELLLTYAELRLLEKHEEAVDVGLKLLPYIKPKLRSHEHVVKEEVKIRFTVGGE